MSDSGIRIVVDTAEADEEQGDYALLLERRILTNVVAKLRHVGSKEIPEAMGDDDDGLAERVWATADMLEQVVADWWPTR
jgi:hypothetical protein